MSSSIQYQNITNEEFIPAATVKITKRYRRSRRRPMVKNQVQVHLVVAYMIVAVFIMAMIGLLAYLYREPPK